jgi:hypothetical protein
MAETVALVLMVVAIAEAFVIWMLNDELKLRRHESDSFRSQLTFDSAVRVSKQLAAAQPRTMTAKDIAAGNLTRQVQRRGKSWADIRNRVESAFEHDPENDRAKRIEKFQGEN